MNKRLYQILEFDAVLEDLARRTHCPVSAERLRHLQPFSTRGEVAGSLQEISEIRAFMDAGGVFPAGVFADLRNYFYAASTEGSRLEPEAFRSIHGFLSLSQRLLHFLKENRADFPRVFKRSHGLSSHQKLAKQIEGIIDLTSLEIKDHASPVLASRRRNLADVRNQLHKQLQRITDSLAKKGVLQEHLVTVRSGRWVLPVKETHRYMVKGVLHDRSASGATAFMEPIETLDLNNRIRQIESEIRDEIERILVGLTDSVRDRLASLEPGFEALVALDCLNAKALTSKRFHQHEPALSVDGRFVLTQARHPLLMLREDSPHDVVPLNLSIGQTFTTLVITGPNAGGKTVALKTSGLLALMVSCGLHIPAGGDSEVPFFQRIYAHIGDDQSIENDLSTFSAHLNGIKGIVEHATSGDLVLIDEIGAGTDPQEGAALAIAVLEHLTHQGALTIVTSHHGTLKAFAHDTPGIANGSMAFDSETLTPTYEFRPNLPGSSYAFDIAGRIGLRKDVIDRSKALMDTKTNRLEDLLMTLEKQITANREQRIELDREKETAEKKRQDLERKRSELVAHEKELRNTAAQKASAVLSGANRAIEAAVAAIRREQASQASIQHAGAIVDEQKAIVKRELADTSENYNEPHPPSRLRHVAAGDPVRWKRGGKEGVVLAPPENDHRVLVGIGGMKVRIPQEELEPGTKKPQAGDRPVAFTTKPSGAASSQMDIRGMRVEEGLSAVDKFLDNAVLSGLTEVKIIHGVGTGALRNSLLPYLDKHPLVQSRSHGPRNHENPGMTIVYIGGSADRS